MHTYIHKNKNQYANINIMTKNSKKKNEECKLGVGVYLQTNFSTKTIPKKKKLEIYYLNLLLFIL